MKIVNLSKSIVSLLQKSKPMELNGEEALLKHFIVFALLRDDKVKEGPAKLKKYKLAMKIDGLDGEHELELSEINSIVESANNVFLTEMYGTIASELGALE